MEKRNPFEQNYYPPVPTPFVQRMRTQWLYQFIRFLILNAKMLRMVRKH